MNTPAIKLTDLHKEFASRSGSGVVKAVDGIDVTINAGEIVAFLGPNGAGKTTTLDMVLGFTEPTQGTVEVLGTSPRKAVSHGHVSAVLQTGGLLHGLTVEETVKLIAGLHKVPERVNDVIERTGLTEIKDRKTQLCSGGEQQRLKFALALLPQPEILVLDEPTAGMDAGARREFWGTMRQEASQGKTIIFATHYLEEAQEFAPRTVLVDGGKIRADRPTDELRTLVGDRVVSATLPGSGAGADGADVDGAGVDGADAGSSYTEATSRIAAVDGVREVRMEGDRVIVEGSASDAVARLLLTDLGASELEVSSPSLESAFFALTQGQEAH
ncbi:MAG: ABC transporter ATP-binding protein [Cellulomonadaceae bacterium]|nr:ABC transporter ATP-binding protein [Cellulomonadaceae bacterium]